MENIAGKPSVVTTEIATFNKKDFDKETIDFVWGCIPADRIVKLKNQSAYVMINPNDIVYLIRNDQVPDERKQGLAQMLEQINYVNKGQQGLQQYMVCIFS